MSKNHPIIGENAMNHKMFLLSVLIVISLIAADYLFVSAETEQEEYSDRVLMTELPTPGKCIHPDRLQICRNRRLVMQFDTNEVRLTGEASFVFDSIYTKAPYAGRAYGIFHLDNSDGSWDGVWKGSTNERGYTLFIGEGHGSGSYDGLVTRWRMARSGSSWLTPMSLSGTIASEAQRTHRR